MNLRSDFQSIDPQEIQRQVVLAFVLEPLPEKEGCTTRTHDANPSLKLEYFQACGVNVGRYFAELAERVRVSRGQPPIFYDLVISAFKDSKSNIVNIKSINHGLIGLMMPIVLSGILIEGDGVMVSEHVTTVLKNSSAKDASLDDEFYALAFATSKSDSKKSFGAQAVGGKNLFEHHSLKREVARAHQYIGGEAWAQELLTGLPLLQKMYTVARAGIGNGVFDATRQAYDVGLASLPYRSPGFAADYAAATMYLLLRDAGKEGKIIL